VTLLRGLSAVKAPVDVPGRTPTCRKRSGPVKAVLPKSSSTVNTPPATLTLSRKSTLPMVAPPLSCSVNCRS
jgi:hypothetical protein